MVIFLFLMQNPCVFYHFLYSWTEICDSRTIWAFKFIRWAYLQSFSYIDNSSRFKYSYIGYLLCWLLFVIVNNRVGECGKNRGFIVVNLYGCCLLWFAKILKSYYLDILINCINRNQAFCKILANNNFHFFKSAYKFFKTNLFLK